jgi:uncharacterized protein (DUF1330 family)
MNTRLKLIALPAILAMAVGSLFATTTPAMVVQVVGTDDVPGYVAMIAKINAVIKTKTGLDTVRHVWEGGFAGEESHGIFVVSHFPSAAAEAEFSDKMKDDPEIAVLLAQLKGMRHLGPSWLYKAVRSEGLYDGGVVYNTGINCTDEGAYLKALDGLKAIFDANGFKDAKINLYRVISGRKDTTHLVVIAFPSNARMAALFDAITDNGIMNAWLGSAGKIRTVFDNGSYHEITK